MTNIDRIFELFLKHNKLTLKSFSQNFAGLKENSLKGSSALNRYKNMTVKILSSRGIDNDYFFKCECGYLNPNDRVFPDNRTDEEIENDKYPCGGCGVPLFS
jgi:hypothetical protein